LAAGPRATGAGRGRSAVEHIVDTVRIKVADLNIIESTGLPRPAEPVAVTVRKPAPAGARR
jgi:hypothetical protein